MATVPAVKRDLKRLPRELAESGIAAVALAMAEGIDSGRGSRSECGKVMLDALSRLRELAPEEETRDGIDQLAERRTQRLADRRAKTAAVPCS